MLGIENPYEYTIKDDYNVDDFFDAFATYDKTKKEVEKYAPFAEEFFKILKRYDNIFIPLHDELSMERIASQRPDRLTKDYISGLISRGKYEMAISHLHIKSHYELCEVLSIGKDTPANEVIDMAFNQNVIDEKRQGNLHKLRKCRNRLLHPEKEQIPFSRADVEKWSDIVFSFNRSDIK